MQQAAATPVVKPVVITPQSANMAPPVAAQVRPTAPTTSQIKPPTLQLGTPVSQKPTAPVMPAASGQVIVQRTTPPITQAVATQPTIANPVAATTLASATPTQTNIVSNIPTASAPTSAPTSITITPTPPQGMMSTPPGNIPPPPSPPPENPLPTSPLGKLKHYLGLALVLLVVGGAPLGGYILFTKDTTVEPEPIPLSSAPDVSAT